MPESRTFNLAELAGPKGPLRMILRATLKPVADLDRFQPAGFPEIGHVIYDAPRGDGLTDKICIVDSPASMGNHLESVCRAAPHDPDIHPDLEGMPYVRCVTNAGWPNHNDQKKKPASTEVVVSSLTEGHRIASTYFLGGRRWTNNKASETPFGDEFANECGILAGLGKKAHAPPQKMWTVFERIFRYDPNALVHGVLFPQWQVKIPRVLTAHLEALGAGRVDRSGVKFDRLGKTTSGQPIFAVDDATAREIRATFVLDLALLRSFGRPNGQDSNGKNQFLGLNDNQKVFLVALALWKVGKLVSGPFRYRSGCDLECSEVRYDGRDTKQQLEAIAIKSAIEAAGFEKSPVTNVYWPADELYRKEDEGDKGSGATDGDEEHEEETDSEEE